MSEIAPRSPLCPEPDLSGLIRPGGMRRIGRQLLLHFDGGDGSAAFTDSASELGAPFTLTPLGGLLQSNTQVKFGASSGDFRSATKTLGITPADDMMMPAIWGFDCWLYLVAHRNPNWIAEVYYDGNNYVAPVLVYNTGMLQAQVRVGGGTHYKSSVTGAVGLNAWHHIAVFKDPLRSGPQFGLGVDGTWLGISAQGGDFVNAQAIFPPAFAHIGSAFNGGPDGFVDEVRWTVGYVDPDWTGTGTYPVPTAPYA